MADIKVFSFGGGEFLRIELRPGTTHSIRILPEGDPDPSQVDFDFRTTTARLLWGGGERLRIDGTGMSFFGAVAVAQPADIGALTDNTGGAADTTLAVVEAAYTQATIRDNFADLAAQVNAIRTVLRNLGLMA